MQTGVFDPADWGLNRAPNLFLRTLLAFSGFLPPFIRLPPITSLCLILRVLTTTTSSAVNASLHIQWETHHAFVLTPDIKLLKSSISTSLSLDQEQRAFDAKLSRRAKGRPNVKRKTVRFGLSAVVSPSRSCFYTDALPVVGIQFIDTLAGEHDDDFFYDIIVLRPLLLGVGPPPRNYVDCYIKTNTGNRVSKLYYPEASGDLVDEQNHVLSPFAHESERPANKELHPGGFVVNSYSKLRQYERIAGRACWRSFSPRAQQLVTLIFYLYYLMFRLELAGNPDDPPDDFDSPSGIAKICSAIYRPYLAQAFSSTPPSPSASEPPSPAPGDDLPPPSSPNPSTPSPPRTPPRADSTTATGLEQTPRALRTRPAQEGASVQIEKEQVKVEEEKVGKAEDLVVAGKSMAWRASVSPSPSPSLPCRGPSLLSY